MVAASVSVLGSTSLYAAVCARVAMRTHAFHAALDKTTAGPVRRRFEWFYRSLYPDMLGVVWHDTIQEAQQAGIDAVIVMHGSIVRVDEKIRSTNYGDMLIEVWSDRDRRAPGWAIDPQKRMDYIAYAIADSHECAWIPFKRFRRGIDRYLQGWINADRRYPRIAVNVERGRTWHTWNVAVPWNQIADAAGVGDVERLFYPW